MAFVLKYGSNRNREPRITQGQAGRQIKSICQVRKQNEQKVAGGRVLHVQRVGAPRRSDLGTEENGNCANAQTAQGLLANKPGSA
eukprot:2871634-Pleurochrysis_carterae.AAC.1